MSTETLTNRFTNPASAPGAGPEKGQFDQSFIVGALDDFVSWGQSYSLWPFPFATACCGIEYMATSASDFDIAVPWLPLI